MRQTIAMDGAGWAALWRARGEEYRATAENCRSVAGSETFEALAESCERHAAWIEERRWERQGSDRRAARMAGTGLAAHRALHTSVIRR
jgi:hypothetical protein